MASRLRSGLPLLAALTATAAAAQATELRFAAAVQWYHQGLISGSKAAGIAGMTRLAFLDELARRRLDTVKIDFDDLAAELHGA